MLDPLAGDAGDTRKGTIMTTSRIGAFAIGYLRDIDFGPEIVGYLERIEATMAPYGGEFLVHGTTPVPLEGEWDGDVIIIGFPDMESARAWYASPAYQELVPLRTRNSRSMVALLEAVPPEYRAADTLARLLGRADLTA